MLQVWVSVVTDQVVTNLEKIVELSGSMLKYARAGEWEQVLQMEPQKRELIEQTFPLDDTNGDIASIIKQIQKISSLDQETMQLAAKSSKEFSGLLSKMNTGRQAVAAYQGVENK